MTMRPALRVARLLVLAALVGCVHPPSTGSAAASTSFRVMSYNIQSGSGNLAGTAEAIRASGADVIGLQEVDVHWADRSHFVDQASALGHELQMQVRFARIYQLPGAKPGDPPREVGVAL